MKNPPWPYPPTPFDDRDDIVELDFVDTSALSDVNGFECRTQNDEDGCKTVEEGSREGAGGGCALNVAPNVDAELSPMVFGRPLQAQAHAVWHASGPAASSSPSPQSGGVKANQPNPASAPVKNHPLEDRKRHLWVTTIRRPSQSPSPMCPTPKSQSLQRGLTARRSPNLRGALRSLRPDTTHSDGNGSMAMMDPNEFVRETNLSFVD